MSWIHRARERAQARLAAARQAEYPPFPGDTSAGPASPVLVVPAAAGPDDGIPKSVKVAGAWSWRILLFLVTGYLLLKLIGVLSVVVIPVVVALLLAALFEPAAAALRNRGVHRSLAAAIVLITGLAVVGGGLTLIVRTFISQFGALTTQLGNSADEIRKWLVKGPLHLSQAQLDSGVERLQQTLTKNQGALTSGALSTAATLGEILAGFFVVLFTLFFFLRDGGQIWQFLCRLLPRTARVRTARAGHYSWHTLVSYVRATVLVAFVDAVGIGIGLFALRVPLALPLAALVFLGAFIPVVGATLSGVVAILIALVTRGPVTALVVLGVVIAVQQLEGHILQPLIMGRAVSLHPLAVILAIATGVVTAGIVGGLVAVPILAVTNTAVRYLADHPAGEPTSDHEPPGTRSTDPAEAKAEDAAEEAAEQADPDDPPADDTSVGPERKRPATSPAPVGSRA